MTETNATPDLYVNTYNIGTGTYDATINFALTPATPPAMGQALSMIPQANIRMSHLNLKVFSYLLQRTVKQMERASGVGVLAPPKLLNDMGISPDDWDAFWKQTQMPGNGF